MRRARATISCSRLMMASVGAGSRGWDLLGLLTSAKGLFCLPGWPGPGFLGLCPQSQSELLSYTAPCCLEGQQDWAEGLGLSLSFHRREGDWHPRLDLSCVLLAPTRP